VLLVGAAVGGAWWGSLLPGRVGHDHVAAGVSVAALRTPAPRPARRCTASRSPPGTPTSPCPTAAASPPGRSTATVPGPALVVTVGELVEVELRNADIAEGVTLHWHGYPVPNGEDGVAGVTQDAVPPGGSFTYRFRADRTGTYWYHSHQLSHVAVQRGLYGTLVVRPAAPAAGTDLTVPIHHPRRHPADGARRTVRTGSRPPRGRRSGCGWSTPTAPRTRSPCAAPRSASPPWTGAT
jgi:FtsP/CotA-like multicopper oxidase with cupredoxin domain